MDSFGVGITYGMRKIRLPLFPTFVIAGCSGIVFFLSMTLGGLLTNGFSVQLTTWIGAMMLILLGSWSIFQSVVKKKTTPLQVETLPDEPVHVFRFELKQLGLIIEILRSPMKADMDQSGSISISEALFLGLALSLDSLAAGFAAVMIGLSPVFCSVVIGIMSAIFIRVGMWFGLKYAQKAWSQVFTYLPGVILICIGLFRFF
jgi:putative sporulation protein YtaF